MAAEALRTLRSVSSKTFRDINDVNIRVPPLTLKERFDIGWGPNLDVPPTAQFSQLKDYLTKKKL